MLARRLLADVVVQPVRLDDLRARPCSTGASPTAGPGRSSPSVLPRSWRTCLRVGADELLAVRARSRRVIFAAPAWCRPMIARLVTLLPEPDSPTMPRRLAPLELERQPVDRLDHAVVGREVHAQVADVQERLAPAASAGTSLDVGYRPRGSGHVDAAHHDRTLGSTTAYRRSTTRFASTMKNAADQHDAEHLGQVVVRRSRPPSTCRSRAARTCSRSGSRRRAAARGRGRRSSGSGSAPSAARA